MNWTGLSNDEMERRRAASVEAMKARDRAEFDRWYQEKCDKDYWTNGQCCAGCDHWNSEKGNIGGCMASGFVSGDQVLKSLGFVSSTFTPKPGYPQTEGAYHCSLFKDDFDWSTLPDDYLIRVGAIRNGRLREKPGTPNPR